MPPSFCYIKIQNQPYHLANVVSNIFGFKEMLLQIFTQLNEDLTCSIFVFLDAWEKSIYIHMK